ncbi:MAG: alpha/beta hydrolase [Nitrososphaerota archaeon]|jgi:pimeloyl-ACP methyl ester carboxylesterase|nr:alpha/beta hydrolase [Nitrososphaerota archaeon]
MESGYAHVDGVKVYYELHGRAKSSGSTPLVLLHGGGDTIGTSFHWMVPELAKNRLVVAFEREGYGRTEDVRNIPFSFEQGADDTVALLEQLGMSQADLFGFSNGGTIALQTAIRHPKATRKLVIASGLFSHDGADAAFWKDFESATLDDMPRVLRETYLRVAPKPENLQLMFDKSVQQMKNFVDIPAEAIRMVEAPALVVCGDSDVVKPEHAVELFRLLPHAQLAVLPGTDHMNVTNRVSWLAPMIDAFLGAS